MLVGLLVPLELLNDVYLLLAHVARDDHFEFYYVVPSQ